MGVVRTHDKKLDQRLGSKAAQRLLNLGRFLLLYV